ncbi:MAG: hypothetical protein JSS79_19920 [Bacteroidetes bacterium]|nr:hypothetical protein [Bacteroidota bacterium]
MKTLVLLSITTLSIFSAFGQIQVDINLQVDDDVAKTSEIKVTIKDAANIVSTFNVKQVHPGTQNQTSVITKPGVYSIAFDYLQKDKWKRTDYEFTVDGKEKRVEIYLDFDRNDRGSEYLKDLTVSKIYTSRNLSIVPVWGMKRGKQPVYKIRSQSDTVFYGQSITSHFYGRLLYRIGDSTRKSFGGSYCESTVSEKPLTKGDSVYSFIPTYNPNNVFVVRLPGHYKYAVMIGTQRYDSGILSSLIRSAKTRKRVLINYELESSFTIE